MANTTKAAAEAALLAAGIERRGYSRDQHCARYGYSMSVYLRRRKQGKGPRELWVGDVCVITPEAEAEWERACAAEREPTKESA